MRCPIPPQQAPTPGLPSQRPSTLPRGEGSTRPEGSETYAEVSAEPSLGPITVGIGALDASNAGPGAPFYVDNTIIRG